MTQKVLRDGVLITSNMITATIWDVLAHPKSRSIGTR
jgi:hypothetical protein